MRVETNEVPVTWLGCKQYYRGSLYKTHGYVGTRPDGEYWNRSRSDITINPVVNGFRNPSDYMCDVTHRHVGNGSYNATFYSNGEVHSEYVYAGGWDVFSDSFGSHTLAGNDLILPPPSAAGRSIVGARNNVADRRASFAESLLEARQTVSFVGRASRSLGLFLAAAARRDVRGASRALGLKGSSKEVSSAERAVRGAADPASQAWLSYHFAVIPLVSDMGAAVKWLSGDGRDEFRVVGKASVPGLEDVSMETWTPSNTGTVPFFTCTSSLRKTSGAYTSLWYSIDEEGLRRLTEFGFTDLPQAAWAVVPWSFVVDWVIPVSEILRSLTAAIGLRYLGGSTTTWARAERESRGELTFPSGDWSGEGDIIFPPLSAISMERLTHPTEPYLPSSLWIRDPFDAWKAVTSMALLASITKR